MNLEKNLKEKRYGFYIRILLTILISIGGLCSLAAGNYFFTDRTDTLTNGILTYIIPFTYLFIVYWIMRKFNFDNDNFFKTTNFKLKTFKTFFIGVLCIIIPLVLSFMENVLSFIDKKPLDNFSNILFKLIVLNICIGFFEEGLFRRIILRSLFKDDSKKSLWIGFLFSSLLFGLIHFGNLSVASQRPIAVTSQVIYAMFLGMLLSALYLRFKSFIGIMLLHSFIDFISFYPILYGQSTGVTFKNVADITLIDAVATVGVLIPSAILGVIILISFSKKYYTKYNSQN